MKKLITGLFILVCLSSHAKAAERHIYFEGIGDELISLHFQHDSNKAVLEQLTFKNDRPIKLYASIMECAQSESAWNCKTSEAPLIGYKINGEMEFSRGSIPVEIIENIVLADDLKKAKAIRASGKKESLTVRRIGDF